jgi:hypothetical protein
MSRTNWDSFEAYGRVPAGESATLRLPAGPISIVFESREPSSRADEGDLPTIVAARGEELPVELIAMAELPYDGDYLVQAGDCEVLIGSAGFARKPSPLPAGAGRRGA